MKAKRLETLEWVSGSLTVYASGKNLIITNTQPHQAFLVNPETVCCSTGKVDKDGNMLFEDDRFSEHGNDWVIKYSSENAMFFAFMHSDSSFTVPLHVFESNTITRICSIHDVDGKEIIVPDSYE